MKHVWMVIDIEENDLYWIFSSKKKAMEWIGDNCSGNWREFYLLKKRFIN